MERGKVEGGVSQPRLKKRLGQDGGMKAAAFADTTYRDMALRFSRSFAAESSQGGCNVQDGTKYYVWTNAATVTMLRSFIEGSRE